MVDTKECARNGKWKYVRMTFFQLLFVINNVYIKITPMVFAAIYNIIHLHTFISASLAKLHFTKNIDLYTFPFHHFLCLFLHSPQETYPFLPRLTESSAKTNRAAPFQRQFGPCFCKSIIADYSQPHSYNYYVNEMLSSS